MKNHLLKYKLHYFLFILAFGIYANTISHDYAWDDAIVITTNDRVQKGFEGIPELIYNFKSEETQHRYGYRPITLATYAIEVGFFGLNPQVSHFNNVLLFALLCVLLFYSIHKIFPDKGKYFAFFVTLIFIVHPLHVEVVANIKSRDEILALLFGLLAINSFINYLKKETKKYINLAFTMLFVVLAFLCKENAATLVGVLVLLIWFLLDVSFKQLLLKSMPVAVIVSAILMIRYWSYSEGVFFDTSIDSLAKGIYGGQDMAGNMLFNYDFGVVLVNSFYISVYYFKLFLFPINLVHDYGTAYVDVVSFSDLVAIFAIVFHLGLLTYMVKTIKKKTPFHFGMLFYFITIFIYLHVLKVGPDYMAERFMFIPSIGLSIVLVDLMSRIFKFNFLAELNKLKQINLKLLITLVCIAVFFSGKSIVRNKAWKDNTTLFKTDIVALENCARANYNYAINLHDQYYNTSPIQQPKLQEKILTHYKKSIDIYPQSVRIRMDLGAAYMEFNRVEKGYHVFKQAAKDFPTNGLPFFELGRYHFSQNEFQLATDYFKQSKKNGWANTRVYYYLSICYLKVNEQEKAVQIIKEGITYQPDYYEYYEYMSDLLFASGNQSDAIYWMEKAIQLNPNYQVLYQKIIRYLNQTGQEEKAQQYQQLELNKFSGN